MVGKASNDAITIIDSFIRIRMVSSSSLLIDALLLDKKTIKKATEHYFLKRQTSSKYFCIDRFAHELKISRLESFSFLMLYRATLRFGEPVTLRLLCRSLGIKKKKFAQQLRLMLYLRFAEKRDMLYKLIPLNNKVSKIQYKLKKQNFSAFFTIV